jgi:DNA-binding transcriptional MerR regulator
MASQHDLLISEVAAVAGVHVNTVRRYSNKGLIEAHRDHNGFRRYSLDEALKLKELVEQRTAESA